MSGHLRKRKNKNGYTWQIVIEQDLDPITGKRNRIFKTVPDCTKKEAEEIMRKMLFEMDNQQYVRDSNVTVGEFLMEWFNTYIAPPHKSPTTSATYLYNIENYIIPRFGKVRLQNLTTMEIQKYYNGLAVKSPLSNRPLTPKTIRNIHMNFNAALKRALKLELIKKNPAENVELLKCKPYKAEVFDSEELKKLIAAIRGSDIEIGIFILVSLGLRRGELMAMQWSDIDFENKIVNIHRSRVKVKGNQSVTKDPTSEAGKRKLDIPIFFCNYYDTRISTI